MSVQEKQEIVVEKINSELWKEFKNPLSALCENFCFGNHPEE